MDKSCWTCGWNRQDPPTQNEEVDLVNPPTFLGVCWGWTKEKGKGMEILATKRSDGKYVADFGCKRWTAEPKDLDGIKRSFENKIIEEEL
jgi:hypothetical protein